MPARKKGISIAVRYEDKRGDRGREELMERMPGEFAGSIPGRSVRPPSVRYTLVVTGAEGETLLEIGQGRGADGKPVAFEVRVVEPDLVAEPRLPSRRPKTKREPRFLLAIGAGTGFGIVSGTSDSAKRPINTGFAAAPFHTSLEIGYAITPNMELALAGRLQVSPGTTVGVEPRIRWLPLTGSIRPYFQAGIAVVQARHNVDLSRLRLPITDDTITAGIVGVGLGGGVSFQASRNVGIGIEAHTLTIVPDYTFAIGLELKFRFRF